MGIPKEWLLGYKDGRDGRDRKDEDSNYLKGYDAGNAKRLNDVKYFSPIEPSMFRFRDG